MTGLGQPIRDPVAHIPPLQKKTIANVLVAVMDEIQRQDDLARAGKFGGKHTMPGGPEDARFRILGEEVGEVAKELNEADKGVEDTGGLYKELVQTAATATAWAAAHIEEGQGYR